MRKKGQCYKLKGLVLLSLSAIPRLLFYRYKAAPDHTFALFFHVDYEIAISQRPGTIVCTYLTKQWVKSKPLLLESSYNYVQTAPTKVNLTSFSFCLCHSYEYVRADSLTDLSLRGSTTSISSVVCVQEYPKQITSLSSRTRSLPLPSPP